MLYLFGKLRPSPLWCWSPFEWKVNNYWEISSWKLAIKILYLLSTTWIKKILSPEWPFLYRIWGQKKMTGMGPLTASNPPKHILSLQRMANLYKPVLYFKFYLCVSLQTCSGFDDRPLNATYLFLSWNNVIDVQCAKWN